MVMHWKQKRLPIWRCDLYAACRSACRQRLAVPHPSLAERSITPGHPGNSSGLVAKPFGEVAIDVPLKLVHLFLEEVSCAFHNDQLHVAVAFIQVCGQCLD